MIKEETRSRTESQVGFYSHLVVYSGLNVMLFVIWVFAGGFPWFIFPLLGWGVGLLAHFMQAFIYTNVTDRR
jgi:hypothetical protein